MNTSTQRPSSSFSTNRTIRRWFLASALVLPALALVLLVLLPVVASRRTPAAASVLPASLTETDGTVLAQLTDRQAEARYLEARLALATRGTHGLSLNMADSVLQIELNGVPLHQARVLGIRASRLLPERAGPMDPPLFTLADAAATIPKVPLRVVEAPRDTAEARTRPPEDILMETRPPHAVLYFAEGLTVRLRPSPSTLGGEALGHALTVRERLREAVYLIGHRAQGPFPAPSPWIELDLAPEDVRTIYRALPPDAGLALRVR